MCQGLTLNRSQWGSCCPRYETLTYKQVSYRWFSTKLPMNAWCWWARGWPAFWPFCVSHGEGLSTPDPSPDVQCGTLCPEGCWVWRPACLGWLRLPGCSHINWPGVGFWLRSDDNPTDGGFPHWLFSQVRTSNVWTCGSSPTEQGYYGNSTSLVE